MYVVDTIWAQELSPTVALLWIDGVLDHLLKQVAVKLALTAVFKQLD